MSNLVESTTTQMVLPTLNEVVQTGQYPTVEPDQRITLNRLVRLVGEEVSFYPEPVVDDFINAEPAHISRGLYIPFNDPRYVRAQQLIKVGVEAHPSAGSPNTHGVVFPSSEFHVVARNARDFARHTAAKARNANANREDRDEVNQIVGRSVGHALSSKIASLTGLHQQLDGERTILRSLRNDLGSSWRAHYKAKNLEKRRVFADEKIHETAETASINLGFGTTAVKGLHRAIKKNLYGGNRSHSEIAYNWRRYISLVGVYTGAKIHKVGLSQEMCETELAKYQHFLNPDAQLVA